jgi:hypothetical protein
MDAAPYLSFHYVLYFLFTRLIQRHETTVSVKLISVNKSLFYERKYFLIVFSAAHRLSLTRAR